MSLPNPKARRAVTPLVVLFFLLAAACHKPAARLAYDSLDGATTAVQAALKAFNSLYQAGLASEEDRAKARAIYETYQKVAVAASYAAEAATTPEERAAVMTKVGNAASDAVAGLDGLSESVRARAPSGGVK